MSASNNPTRDLDNHSSSEEPRLSIKALLTDLHADKANNNTAKKTNLKDWDSNISAKAKVIIELTPPTAVRGASCKTCSARIIPSTYRIKDTSGYHHTACYLERYNIMKRLPNLQLSTDQLDDGATDALNAWLASAKESLHTSKKTGTSEPAGKTSIEGKENVKIADDGKNANGKRQLTPTEDTNNIESKLKKSRTSATGSGPLEYTDAFGLPIATITMSNAGSSTKEITLPVFPASLQDLFRALEESPMHFSGPRALRLMRSL